jgi:transposase
VIQQLAKPLEQCSADELWRGEAALELEALKAVTKLLREVERKLEGFAASDESVKLLRSIPGVGRCTAEVVVAYLDNPQRFENGRQVSAYAGLVPKQFQSGETDRRGRISRRGPSLLRKMLVEAGWILLPYNPWAQRLMQRLSRGQKTRRKQAIVALARKLLVRCWAMLRDSTEWREPPPATATA